MSQRILTKELAEQFLSDQSSVSMSAFTAIDDDAAEALIRIQSDLHLSIHHLSDFAAERLSEVSGELLLFELRRISDKAIRCLSNHRGDRLTIDFSLIETDLTDMAAEDLAQYKGKSLYLVVRNLLQSAARILSNYQGNLSIYCEPPNLPEEAARGLGSFHGPSLTLGVESLEGPSAKSLSKIPGKLNFFGLDKLSDAAAKELEQFQGPLSLSMKELSDTAAKSMSRIRGSLDLSKLQLLSDRGVEYLSRYQGDVLDLGLLHLSDTAAASLGNSQAKVLTLRALESLSDAAAERLSGFRGKLMFNPSRLPDSAAAILQRHWFWTPN